jgi:TRAP-type uncharacterized transport system fused permease subunit
MLLLAEMGVVCVVVFLTGVEVTIATFVEVVCSADLRK